MNKFKQADLKKIKTISLKGRRSKAHISSFGHPMDEFGAEKFLESLPRNLKAADLLEFINRVIKARRHDKPVHVLMGAHVIKVGLSPVIIDLMERRIITGISMNSAGLIHDLETAFAGRTSEDVQAGLTDGSFGMAEETGKYFNEVVDLAEKELLGLGEAAGKYINANRAKYAEYSIFAAADRLDLPATVHLVVGTDIVHQQDGFKAGPAAEASYRDFKILASILGNADNGGVAMNIGSAVILPEVFLKALTVSRNLKKGRRNITTANFDMIAHYRPMMNVVNRPTAAGGRGFNFIGHHEIMIPLLSWGLKSYMNRK
ncbi:MAG: hypothetical protein AB1746_06120 [Candidatus Zixiibacteriota bacterium]